MKRFGYFGFVGVLALTGCAASNKCGTGQAPGEGTPCAATPQKAHSSGDGAHHQHHGGVHHDFSDAASWSKQFDDPARDGWQKPDVVTTLLALKAGMIVADVGAGTGYFEPRVSRAVGGEGRVIGLDVEPNMVAFMRERFAREGLTNAEARQCPFDGTGLPAQSVDRVLIVDTWHHIEHREAYAKHLREVLRPGGFVAIVDFTLETDKGPPKQHRLAPDTVLAELRAGGLDASLLEESLPDQYVAVGRVP